MSIQIRPLENQDDYAAAVRLQREIWGFNDIELLPERLFIVASKVGGLALGAFDRSKMVGFCLCIPGLKQGGKPYLHSHMLGVLPEFRNTGLGRSLKLMQREFALSQGMDLIEWTFDPLEIKNAFFNIERLGAVVRRYVRNQYGTTTSHLHGGLPTDRLIAEWWIRSPRVNSLCDEGKAPYQHPLHQAEISVPANIAEIRCTDRARARAIQVRIADEFERYLMHDALAVIGFRTTYQSATYLLSKWHSQ